ncbi:MAG: HAD-IA family hydrolase [Clostridia bacterium]|nr:HAD-IA family hydrolase [Clostridia bacterium]
MKFRNFIWDFDGCLCDSYPHTTQVFYDAMTRPEIDHGGREKAPVWDELFRRLQVTWVYAREQYGVTEAENAYVQTHESDFTYEPVPVMFPGIPEVLAAIKAAGGQNFLYTLRDSTAIRVLEAEGLADLFTDFVVRENGFPGKPAPDAILYLLEKHGLEPAETVMIGDRDLDGQSGIHAGTAGCLLTYLEKNCHGEDPLDVTAMPYKCRGVEQFRSILEI